MKTEEINLTLKIRVRFVLQYEVAPKEYYISKNH